MRKTLFGKYFTVCAVIIFISFVILGSIQLTLLNNYSRSEKEKTLKDNAKMISRMTTQLVSSNSIVLQDAYYYIIASFAKSSQADIIVTDVGGKALAASSDAYNGAQVSAEVMAVIKKGETFNQTGMFMDLNTDAPKHVIGVPIFYQDQVFGAVFITSSAQYIQAFTAAFLRMSLMAMALVMLFACIVVYFVTARLLRPISQMNIAARKMADGDFSTKISVNTEDEVAELAVSFNNMARSVKNLEDMRRDFISNVSHELKTPMTTIGGFIDGMLDHTIEPEQQEKYLHIVSDEVKRLSRLVNSLLDISRIEAGKMELNPTNFDIAEQIRNIIISFGQQIDEKQIEIDIDFYHDSTWVYADRDAIYRVIYNLLGNALKFTDAGGVIRFTLARKSDQIFVSVYNTGIGIKSEDLSYVFERFYKADKSRGLDRKGTGLGLYIVKSILKLHGEDIWVKSEYGKYCEFGFTLKKGNNKSLKAPN